MVSEGLLDELNEFDRYQQECLGVRSDESCLAKFSDQMDALGIKYVVRGYVGTVGDSYFVELSLLKVNAADPWLNSTQVYFNGTEDQLMYAVRHAGRKLFGV